MKRMLLLAVTAMVAAGAACSGDALKAGDARLTVSREAEVLAAAPGRALERVEGGRTLPSGSTVKVLSGSAALALASGQELELRRDSEVRLGNRPTLVRGDLLVTSTGDRPLTVSAAGSQVLVSGAARLSRDLAVSAASYRGRLRLSSAGRTLEIPALRQGDIPSLGVVPARPEPLDYDPSDRWDRRFLGQAIELGEELQAKSEGFTSSLRPTEGRTPGYFRLLIPALEQEPSFGPPLLTAARPPGETLVGATIVVAAEEGSFLSRWGEVFAFRDQGAPWGLVALDQEVDDAGGLVQSLDAAIGRATLAFAPTPPDRPSSTVSPGPRGTPAGGGSGPAGGSGTGSGAGSGTGGGGGGGGGSTPPPAPSPSPSPSGPRIPPTTLPPTTLPPAPPPEPPGTPPPATQPVQPVVDHIVGLLSKI